MGDPLYDCSPLISAASSGKLRLVRLLVEGGAQVNGRNPKGETALLAACKALRGEPAAPDALKLITYLLQNKVSLQSPTFPSFHLGGMCFKCNLLHISLNGSSTIY